MLNTTSGPILATHPRQISQNLPRQSQASPRARARLAAEILDEHAVVTKLTAQQVAGLCRVSIPRCIRRETAIAAGRQTSRSRGVGAGQHRRNASNSSDAPGPKLFGRR